MNDDTAKKIAELEARVKDIEAWIDRLPSVPRRGRPSANIDDRVLGALERHGALSEASLRNRLNVSPGQVQDAIANLKAAGRIRARASTRMFRGKIVVLWYAVEAP